MMKKKFFSSILAANLCAASIIAGGAFAAQSEVVRVASPRDRFPQFFEYVESINCTDSATALDAMNSIGFDYEQVFVDDKSFDISDTGASVNTYMVKEDGTYSYFRINGELDEDAIAQLVADMRADLGLSEEECYIHAYQMEPTKLINAFVGITVTYRTEDDNAHINTTKAINSYLSEKYDVTATSIIFGNNDVFNAAFSFGGAVYADSWIPVTDADEISNINAELASRGLEGTLTLDEKNGGSYVSYTDDTTLDEIWATTVILKNEFGIRAYDYEMQGAYDPISINNRINLLAPKGDANASGDATISDVVSVLQFGANAEKYPLDMQAQFNCDMNEDNIVNAKDAYDIQVMISQ